MSWSLDVLFDDGEHQDGEQQPEWIEVEVEPTEMGPVVLGDHTDHLLHFYPHTFLHRCFVCGLMDSCLKQCSQCKRVRYCSDKCQQIHWPRHKIYCQRPFTNTKQGILVAVSAISPSESEWASIRPTILTWLSSYHPDHLYVKTWAMVNRTLHGYRYDQEDLNRTTSITELAIYMDDYELFRLLTEAGAGLRCSMKRSGIEEKLFRCSTLTSHTILDIRERMIRTWMENGRTIRIGPPNKSFSQQVSIDMSICHGVYSRKDLALWKAIFSLWYDSFSIPVDNIVRASDIVFLLHRTDLTTKWYYSEYAYDEKVHLATFLFERNVSLYAPTSTASWLHGQTAMELALQNHLVLSPQELLSCERRAQTFLHSIRQQVQTTIDIPPEIVAIIVAHLKRV